METTPVRQEMLAFTTEIVASYVGNHMVASGDLPALITGVFGSLSSTGVAAPNSIAEQVPAVPIKKSVGTDYIVCLEDGKKLKMLRRHLKTRYDMTPDDYRRRWGLSPEYPMVAPAYAARRSELAKSLGLGRKVASAPVPELVMAPMLAPIALVEAQPRAVSPLPDAAATKSRSLRVGGRRKTA